ncbi:hypothetical protein V5E97_24175 [Singulisphaera sp. Ch08]|uniref:Secreted protein n=1 Tax=Singulisphaera sp. Ch08 TaxID=3120278 RepID=A0AAU7C8J7_9BACT
MRRRILAGLGGLSLLVFSALGLPGCGPGTVAEPASPVVSPDSEAGKKAREQDAKLMELRRQQEAKLRHRMKGLPVEE